jgi:hypothetical protein
MSTLPVGGLHRARVLMGDVCVTPLQTMISPNNPVKITFFMITSFIFCFVSFAG